MNKEWDLLRYHASLVLHVGRVKFSILTSCKNHSAKQVVDNRIMGEHHLSSVALGNAYAECFRAFTDCPGHLARLIGSVDAKIEFKLIRFVI